MTRSSRSRAHSLSVTAETYAKLKAEADKRGVPVSKLVEEMLAKAGTRDA